jgi:16S rRNA (guanine527-N7)-methyltransferase
LPGAYADALDAGLDALGLVLDPGARSVIDGHMRLLLAWTRSINLTAIRDPAAAAIGHVVDSLTAVPILRDRGADGLLDLGSGGGLPGFPLAAAMPAVHALLVESVGKKAAFLRTAVTATGIDDRVQVGGARAEALATDPRHRGRWSVVTARAVAPLAELVELAFPLLAPGGSLVAWKRGESTEETRAAERAITALGGGDLERHPVDVAGLGGHVLVVATRTGVVPDAYPRATTLRKRRPW